MLRNIIRFREKERARGEDPPHVAVDPRTLGAFQILMELKKAGEKIGIELKASI